jgi:DNA-binding NarL/FixJ family response regulator
MMRARVLVADDVAFMRSLVTALLKNLFDVVETVSNGRTALKRILKLQPDLVVLDVSMPGMNGIEVASELKRRGSKAKIVFLSSYEDLEIQATCLSVGGLGYVLKDLIATDLVVAMHQAFAGHKFVSHRAALRGHG